MMEFDPIQDIIANSSTTTFYSGCCLLRHLHSLSFQLLDFATKNCIRILFFCLSIVLSVLTIRHEKDQIDTRQNYLLQHLHRYHCRICFYYVYQHSIVDY
jgi:hypothetical protein